LGERHPIRTKAVKVRYKQTHSSAEMYSIRLLTFCLASTRGCCTRAGPDSTR